MKRIRYIGRQPRKRANVLAALERSTVVWQGHGDIQTVTDEEAIHLLNPQYDKIWVDADAAAKIPPGRAALAQAASQPAPAAAPAPAPAPVEEQLTEEQVKDRLVAIVTVIPKLTRTDFDNQGRPTLMSLGALLGYPVTAAERDAAWESVKAFSAVPGVADAPAAATEVSADLLVVKDNPAEAAAPAEVVPE